MVGLTSLEVCNSIYKLTEEKNIFKLHTMSHLLSSEHIFETVRNIAMEKLGIPDITQDKLDDETIGPFLIEEHRNTYQQTKHAKSLINSIHR